MRSSVINCDILQRFVSQNKPFPFYSWASSKSYGCMKASKSQTASVEQNLSSGAIGFFMSSGGNCSWYVICSLCTGQSGM